MAWFTIFLVLMLRALLCLGDRKENGYEINKCIINIHDNNSEINSVNQPLLIKDLTPRNSKSNLYDFYLPTNYDGRIEFNPQEKIIFACPGDGNHFQTFPQSKVFEVKCSRGDQYDVAGVGTRNLRDLLCVKLPQADLVEDGLCFHNRHTKIRIQYKINTIPIRDLTIIEICFDKAHSNTIYSRADLQTGLSRQQVILTAKNFILDNRFHKYDIPTQYKKERQNINLHALLDTTVDYIDDGHMLTKGHLTAKSDFVYKTHQQSTYYYINTAPQWNNFNEGNWNYIETALQNFAGSYQTPLIAYTGTYGHSQLNAGNGNPADLFLYYKKNRDKTEVRQTPVPLYFWKVVIDSTKHRGVVIIGVNNRNAGAPNIFCPKDADLCKSIKWLQGDWNRNDVTKGVIYCCKVPTFKLVVTGLPADVSASKLLCGGAPLSNC